ncbi:hypothetical protein RA268_28760, partial [Pseudomonas syringae pv. tagetis]
FFVCFCCFFRCFWWRGVVSLLLWGGAAGWWGLFFFFLEFFFWFLGVVWFVSFVGCFVALFSVLSVGRFLGCGVIV